MGRARSVLLVVDREQVPTRPRWERGALLRILILGSDWYSRPELNWNQRFRKPLLYPFELREPPSVPIIIIRSQKKPEIPATLLRVRILIFRNPQSTIRN
jgi:hypothetical protein